MYWPSEDVGDVSTELYYGCSGRLITWVESQLGARSTACTLLNESTIFSVLSQKQFHTVWCKW